MLFLLLLLWFCDEVMILQQGSWVTLCMIFRLKHLNNRIISFTTLLVPIITFTLTIWSFMFSVGYKSSNAHNILLSNCWLHNIKSFMVITSIWTFLLNETPFVSFFFFTYFLQFVLKNYAGHYTTHFFILK